MAVQYFSSQWHCGHCQHDQQLLASCGNRSCPQCLHQTTSNWLVKQTDKLLPVHHFMVTFTLPYQLRVLARQHPKALYQLMLKVTAGILKDFAKRENKGSLGFTSVLHTHTATCMSSSCAYHCALRTLRYDKETMAQK